MLAEMRLVCVAMGIFMQAILLSRRFMVVIALVAPIALVNEPRADGIDHKIHEDTSGIWNQDIYRNIMLAMTIGQVGYAVWEGGDSRLGNTAWRGIDSEIIGAVSAEGLKHVFRRVRPSDTDNPGLWFQSGDNHSFPSGEAAEAASLVTPYILEYGKDHPAVYALTLLPLYVGAARVKAQAHWQTDVIGGWVVGGLAGWYAHERDTPIVLQLLPHGISIGLKKSF